jgi:uncharacterized protein (TIGR02271 family)
MNNGKEEFEISNHSEEFSAQDAAKITIPILEEEIKVTKKVIDTGRVNISKTIQESTEHVDIPLFREEIIVSRIPKNEIIDIMPAASRYEGDVMIIPVLKEVAVIEKRMMLVEEIHVTKIKAEKIETQEVTVRKEEVNITRKDL